MTTLTLSLQNIHCGGCVGRAERAMRGVDGVTAASVNLATRGAEVQLDRAEQVGALVDGLARAGYPAVTESLEWPLTNMHCGSCITRVERAATAVPGVIAASASMATETVQVQYLVGDDLPDRLRAALARAGYPVAPGASRDAAGASTADAGSSSEDPADDTAHDPAMSALTRNLIVAAILTLPVFVLEMGSHLIAPFHHWVVATIGQTTSWAVQGALTTVLMLGPGRMFYRQGVPALWHLRPDMNSLVAVGTLSAYLYSLVALFAPGLLPEGTRAVYFEATAVIITLILTGRWLEARARGRTGTAIRHLMGLQPRTAWVEREGTDIEVPLADVGAGDTLLLRPGAQVPVDGEVLSGETFVDESMLTGEAMAVAKTPGSALTGGTINGAGVVRMRATRVGRDTALAQIIRMVQSAQGAKLPVQALVDRVTLWFVPAVMALAALTALIWLAFGPDLTFALVAGVTVLIIACPCAMGLATPVSIMVAIGRGARLGILFRKGTALQTLERVRVVAFDKTGTLTMGKPALTDLEPATGFDANTVLALVAGAEGGSEHPIATALIAAARDRGLTLPPVIKTDVQPGLGLRAEVGGKVVLVGNRALLSGAGVVLPDAMVDRAQVLAGQGKTALFAALDGQAAMVLAVADPVKPGSRDAIKALHEMGVTTAMITGDADATARAIAAEIGIDHVVAGVLPAGKVAALDNLRAKTGEHGALAFVGDGINDAPALAHADVGVAIGTGTDVAIEAADVVLVSGDPGGIVTALDLSRHTMRNIRQNLFWAFGYNAALIPVAAGVLYPAFGILLSPMLAAGAMALSSVFVLTNALRLRRFAPARATRGGADAREGQA
ncbi:heavy metal translocating P-type ATPase [Roseicitreum antarcticum]|uniref:Cu+-exporting ATPase n=1 Tax=Roseicitreum antarcticum TaxID=564137 RepID=A0A1H2XP64_9RHOB|nr:heavy metal translocating P-type ATPase [Roseicitreum antarcticum]SDW94109.1 Cu+-exporting ATPase [Roseicitreum antarcticum]